MNPRSHLPRLTPAYYRGMAMVHWTLTLDQRATGWLQALFHARFREILLHTCCRYGLCCPVYCLMPDHLHQIWLGEKQSANQFLAMRFFRQQVARWLHPFKLQKQAYDNVLREKDREQDAFRATRFYILENPVRAGLVTNAKEWEFSGCMMPGFPDLHPLDERFDRVFWGRYSDLARGNTPP